MFIYTAVILVGITDLWDFRNTASGLTTKLIIPFSLVALVIKRDPIIDFIFPILQSVSKGC